MRKYVKPECVDSLFDAGSLICNSLVEGFDATDQTEFFTFDDYETI